MLYVGIGLALAAACCNSAIDASRKAASVLVPSAALVALPALLEACLACSFIAALGGFDGVDLSSLPSGFFVVTLLSSVIQFGAKLLYQRALALAPLSLTVPYLSCTPGVHGCAVHALAHAWWQRMAIQYGVMHGLTSRLTCCIQGSSWSWPICS